MTAEGSITFASWAEGFGELILARRDSHFDDKLIVIRADPRVLIAAELLDGIRQADSPDTRLVDDVLTIDADNQKVIYRIGEYLMQPDAYVAEWPD